MTITAPRTASEGEPFVIAEVQCRPSCESVVTLASADGREVRLTLRADCCSSSYFEDASIEEMKGLVGQTLRTIEERAQRIQDKEEDWSHHSYHCLVITTDKASLSVDWRNESNGYYDGNVEVSGWHLTEPLICRQCEGVAEEERRCYATPVCFACLPPPAPLPTKGGA